MMLYIGRNDLTGDVFFCVNNAKFGVVLTGLILVENKLIMNLRGGDKFLLFL